MTMTEERPGLHRTTFEKTGGEVVRLPRRTIDKLLVAIGLVAAIMFAAAGAMLMWGSNFAQGLRRRARLPERRLLRRRQPPRGRAATTS